MRDNLDDVQVGDVIAEYVPRCYFESYEQLCDVAQGCIAKLEDAFLTHVAITSGQTNWKGNGVLIPQSFAGVLREYSSGHYLDTKPLFPYIDKEFGIATLPAVEFDAVSLGFERRVNGINYNTVPVGSMFRHIDLSRGLTREPQFAKRSAGAAARRRRRRGGRKSAT